MVSINYSDLDTELEVEIFSKKYRAIISEKPFYDPKKKLASS